MYVLDHDRQILLIREMTQLRKDSENWEVYYHHPSTNAMWKSYFPKANGKHRGPKILRIEPLPESLEGRLESCLQDSIPENAMGLGIELSVSPQQWEPVISLLEENYRQYDRKQLSLFLMHSGIEEYQQVFEDLNHSYDDFNFTEEKLEQLARRSKVIRFKRFWFF